MKNEIVFMDIEINPNFFLIGFKRAGKEGGYLQISTKKDPLTVAQRNKIVTLMSQTTTITFNGLRYDMPMLYYALSGVTTQALFELSCEIVKTNTPSWTLMKKYKLREDRRFDHIDISEPAPGVFVSLKSYGARMYSKKLQDLPYAYDKELDATEIKGITLYNRNDLDTTEDLFNAILPRLKLREKMSEQYGVDLRSKSDAQIAETVLVSELEDAGVSVSKAKVPKSVLYHAPECVSFARPELRELHNLLDGNTEFTINPGNGSPELPDWLKKTKLVIGETTYQVGLGGLHSKEKKLVVEAPDGYSMRNVDVAQYYPSMILGFGFYPKRLTTRFLDVYNKIYATRNDPVKGLKVLIRNEKAKLKELENVLSTM